jgi:hypothetical protein
MTGPNSIQQFARVLTDVERKRNVEPTFTDRTELTHWVTLVTREAGDDADRQIEAIETIRRVLIAHVHLLERKPND